MSFEIEKKKKNFDNLRLTLSLELSVLIPTLLMRSRDYELAYVHVYNAIQRSSLYEFRCTF